MPLEIERRFLVSSPGWHSYAGFGKSLRQCYLVVSKTGIVVRVRISNGESAWLTLKAPAEGIARHEFEYSIPLRDAEDLWKLSQYRLVKKRYEFIFEGEPWIVDTFEGANYPLELAEIELTSEDSALKVPDWCGSEVTRVGQFTNAALAQNPFSEWPEEERKNFFA